MQLLVLRHADAEPAGKSDFDRALTSRGAEQAVAVGHFCKSHRLRPELILSSPLRRALQTAELVAKALGDPPLVQAVDFLKSGMTIATARKSLVSYENRDMVMIVGHEPDLSALCGDLLGTGPEAIHLRKASLLRVDLSAGREGTAVLEFLLPVKLL